MRPETTAKVEFFDAFLSSLSHISMDSISFLLRARPRERGLSNCCRSKRHLLFCILRADTICSWAHTGRDRQVGEGEMWKLGKSISPSLSEWMYDTVTTCVVMRVMTQLITCGTRGLRGYFLQSAKQQDSSFPSPFKLGLSISV
jgi:hypothetical protein